MSKKSKEPIDNPNASDAHANIPEEPVSHGFSKAFDQEVMTLENRTILAMTDSLANDFAKAFSRFMGAKFEVNYTTLKYVDIAPILKEQGSCIYASFIITGQHHHGLILFQSTLLNDCINFLFGSDVHEDGVDASYNGACSLKIARTIATLFLAELQQAISVFTDFQGALLECSNKAKSVIRSHYIPEKACQLQFEVSGMASVCTLSVILPESVMELLTQTPHTQHPEPHKEHLPASAPTQNGLHGGLIDTSVDLIALLPPIKLKLSEAMNLKKGDTIPISNPEQVELCVGEQRTYKALVGQSNALRVVKITDALL